MIVKYFCSSSEGDIPITEDAFSIPFKISPSENHPFLTLGDYFEAIKTFLLKDQVRSVVLLLKDHFNKSIRSEQIDNIMIRSEKHGALYHLASVEIFINGQPIKYALNTAISEKGKAFLNHEYDLLHLLGESFHLPYLPKAYLRGEVKFHHGRNRELLSMFLSEWFEDYHEWHLTFDDEKKTQQICLWDQKGGYRFATKEESFEIFKQASKILTLFYNTRDFRQIYPWHHAAGDFVVRRREGVIDVKLTTARRYDPVMICLKKENTHPLVAILYFFLNLTIKMRLDKLEGVGKVAWADDSSLEAATKGFFEALSIMETEGKYHPGKVEDLIALLKSFSQEEMNKLFKPLLQFYREEDPNDFQVIKRNLEDHTREFHKIMQKFPG